MTKRIEIAGYSNIEQFVRARITQGISQDNIVDESVKELGFPRRKALRYYLTYVKRMMKKGLIVTNLF